MLFDIQYVTVGQNLAQTTVSAIFLAWVMFSLVLYMFKWLICGWHLICQLVYIIFENQHITVGQKLSITIVLAIFWFWFGLVLDWINWHIWGGHWIPHLEYMLDYQYVTGPKISKNLGYCIILDLVQFGFRLVQISYPWPQLHSSAELHDF